MRKILSLILLLTAISGKADNTKTEVEQVTESVTISEDVDYIITADEPFGTMGSVDITNTDHAVLIIKAQKPSVVIANLMSHIFINGEQAVNGTNCQVKMYNRGAIVFPYASTMKPLTCYTEENFGGDSYSNYGLGNSGGYMNTLSATSLNNRIRSFKLKRGYMVTFAVGTSGWGYSRCFIADQADLEVSAVPAPLNGKISSYRIFHWYNAHKAGGASSGDASFNKAINSSWCYDWAEGNASLLPDVEWVPNHIYEDYPSSAKCGGVTGSCHMKTNNEPGNSADDHPQSVEEVLANWQNLMRTGMRLCSESSHDGSWSHLRAFIDSIDARGWRCDLLDLHCYWGAGSFNDFSGYYNSYGGRPIWISEWMWGASWNSSNWSSGGIFAQAPDGPESFSTANQQCLYNNTVPIINKLNASKYVERYAFWNGERVASKIYYNGQLSLFGQYYATMDDGLAYNASVQKIPNIVYKAPSTLSGTYDKQKSTFALDWTDPNGDMLDSMVVECKLPGTARFIKLTNVAVKDKTSANDLEYAYTDTISDAGIYYYRVSEYYNGGKKFVTNEVSVTIAAAKAVGAIQYGQLKIANTESVSTDIEPQEVAPYVVMGMLSNKNSSNGITNQIQSISKSSFKYRLYPWTLPSPVEISSAENVDYLVLPPDTVYHLSDEMMLISQKIGNVKGTDIQVSFPEAFPEGVTPIVLAQQNTAIASYAPVITKVFDITNTGFTIKLVRQEGVTSAFNAQNVNYFACSPGQIKIGNGKLLTAGRNNDTPCGGATRQAIYFTGQEGDTLHLINPYIIANAQTNNYEATSVFRQQSTSSDSEGVYCANILRKIDGTTTTTVSNSAKTNGDYIGWIIISDDPNGTGDEKPIITPTGIQNIKNESLAVSTHDGCLWSENTSLRAYNAAGIQVPFGKRLPAGIYIITNGKQSTKLNLR